MIVSPAFLILRIRHIEFNGSFAKLIIKLNVDVDGPSAGFGEYGLGDVRAWCCAYGFEDLDFLMVIGFDLQGDLGLGKGLMTGVVNGYLERDFRAGLQDGGWLKADRKSTVAFAGKNKARSH